MTALLAWAILASVASIAAAVFFLMWRNSEGRANRINDEPRVIRLSDIEDKPEPTPRIEDRIAAAFPPDPVMPSVPLPLPDTTANVPVEVAQEVTTPIVSIKRKPRKRKAKR